MMLRNSLLMLVISDDPLWRKRVMAASMKVVAEL